MLWRSALSRMRTAGSASPPSRWRKKTSTRWWQPPWKACCLRGAGCERPRRRGRDGGEFPVSVPVHRAVRARPGGKRLRSRRRAESQRPEAGGHAGKLRRPHRVLDISRGPSVTRYEVQPMAGVKISRITSLADASPLNLAVADVRMELPSPASLPWASRCRTIRKRRSTSEASSRARAFCG